ncbi:ABC transporter permease [Sphingomicrobium marinum]|uniref:ABC transporter permease n=1 Tax=Sphingomicrobium marinum TaxID=1227950 RepID=UPI00223F82F0|nr:ABC transporter permease [Sphingomicrobium marinum]
MTAPALAATDRQRLPEWLRAALVIGRRDYVATVFSKTFFFFLFGPLFPILLGGVFGGVGSQIADSQENPRVAVVASQADYDRIIEASRRLTQLVPAASRVDLQRFEPEANVAAQRQRLLDGDEGFFVGVLEDPFAEEPWFRGSVGQRDSIVRQLNLFISEAKQAETASPVNVELELDRQENRAVTSAETQRKQLARGAQLALFFVTLLLATMLLSQMLEEKSNKVIEVLAAAVPVTSIFVGKLFAMLAISLTGLIIWMAIGLAGFFALASDSSVATLFTGPAVGWPLFLFLMLVYFAMSYLLIGAFFLGIGAQASTARDVQIMSMPMTFLQVALVMLAFVGVSQPGSVWAWAAILFPLSSPFAMAGIAAQESAGWYHLVGIAYQALWVFLILRVSAIFFKRSVLKSRAPKRAKKSASAIPV